MEHFFESIPGNFTFAQLYSEAVARAPHVALFVEVGVWKGRSAAYMGVEIVNSGKAITFCCIDLWEKTPIPSSDYEPAKLEEFYHSMRPLRGYFKTHQGHSAESAKRFEDKSVDFVFIDADHSYEAVKRDILAWLPKVKLGGTIAGHDYDPYYPGVIQAVNELFPTCNAHECGQLSWRVEGLTEAVRAYALTPQFAE